MTAIAPTIRQIKAQASAVQRKIPGARVIGIQAQGRWSGGNGPLVDQADLAIYQCDSPLALRVAMRQPVGEQITKVLVTPLDNAELSEDIRLRLAKRCLLAIRPWEIVRSLFQAHAVDPRLTKESWIAEALLESMPTDAYPAARGGFLDADTVWMLLLQQAIGLPAEAPDMTSLLKWSLDPDSTDHFRRSRADFRSSAIAWLAEKAGPAAEVMLRSIEVLDRPDAVPLGLAIGVVFHPTAARQLERAAGKFEERFLRGKDVAAETLQRWHTAATEVVRALRHTGARIHRQTLQRVDEILGDIQAAEFAHLSDTSPLGFEQRLARFGRCLSETVDGPTGGPIDELNAARLAIRNHDLAAEEPRRLDRVDMALRLVRWLREARLATDVAPQSFVEAATYHCQMGGFVDWARLSLRAGDSDRVLSEAYARLYSAVTEIRERQAQRFALLLSDWTGSGSRGDGILPVERMLEEVIAPLAGESPVLVIVVDGMSVAVGRELMSDLTRRDWVALCEPSRACNRPGIATIPSVTEFSRTSLLTGRLQQGSANEERQGFAEHAAMLAQCRGGYPPILFHKASLNESEDAVLAADVRNEIASTHRQIVGVVINAVDDHLLKGEQIDTRWSRDEIKVLPALLHEARNAGRLVILISDHGHVLDRQSAARPAEGGERWRTPVGQPLADEIEVRGDRVLVAGGRLIAPWSERVRYGIKKNGYHGGLSPQEMVFLVTVLASGEDYPGEWHEQPADVPDWWDEPLELAPAAEQPVAPPPSIVRPPSGMLFDLDADETASPAPVAASAPAWIVRLLGSPVFLEQKRRGGRSVPSDLILGQVLTALDQRGGKLTAVALARVLTFPTFRMPGLLAQVQRILNVDGYAIVGRDDASDTIELNRPLLLKQFDLL